MPNKAAPDAGDSAAIPSSFLRNENNISAMNTGCDQLINSNVKVVVDNKKRNQKIMIYGLVWTTSLIVTLIIGIIIGRAWQYSFDQEFALSNLAERLKVENNPQVIRDTVHCQLLDMGASKSVISKNLNLVGGYQEYESWNGSISIVFDDYFTQLVVHELVLRFEDDKLVDKRFEVTPDSTIPIECP